MKSMIGVKFRENGKAEYFLPCEESLKIGDEVLCDTSMGIRNGKVCALNKEMEDSEEEYKIIRIVTPRDKDKIMSNKEKAKIAFSQTQKVISRCNLDMKLLEAEYTFDMQKLIFTFSSEDRVDFRELLKELAQMFKVRIELRQIGIRDEVKIIGGLGPCGRIACCNLFLSDYGKVGIKMAKQQSLSLSPTKINGICGKIMCCIAYENDTYVQNSAVLPKINQMVKTPDGKGIVMYLNILEKKVTVKILGDDERLMEYPAEEIKTYEEQ